MTPTELKNALAQFTGTEGYLRYNPLLFPKVMLTDGAQYLADNAGAYWLMDVIASHLPSVPRDESFAVVAFSKHGSRGHFVMAHDFDEGEAIMVFASQDIEYTDFPLDEIKLYVARDGVSWVVMLTSEY